MSRTISSGQHAYVVALALLMAGNAYAHDYWVDRSGETYTLYQGHVFSQHAGEARVPYDPAIVSRVVCSQQDARAATLEPVRAYPLRVTAACAAVLFELSSGYWSQTLTDTVQKPRNEVRGALRGWRSEETVKRIDRWTPAAARPLSEGLELTLLEDPFQLRPGDKLRLLATWRGRPLAGAAIAYDGAARGVTGPDGQANLRVRHGGIQTLSASFEEAVQADPLADKVVRATILQLELQK